MISTSLTNYGPGIGIIAQDGITCGAIDEASRTSNAIEKRVIINFCDQNAVIACFHDKMMLFIFMTNDMIYHDMS